MSNAKLGISIVLMTVFSAGILKAEGVDDGTTVRNALSAYSLDAEVQVNSGPRLGNRSMSFRKSHNSAASQVYYPPALLPEWEAFTAAVGASCGDTTDSDLVLEVPLRIHVDDKFYIEDVSNAILGIEGQGISDNAIVRSIPFSRMIVFLLPEGQEEQVLYDTARRGRISDLERPRLYTTYPPELNVEVLASCPELRTIIEDIKEGNDRLLEGVIFASEVTYELTEVRASVSASLKRAMVDRLFSDETFEQTTTAKSGSTGSSAPSGDDPLSIAMNLIGGGGSKVSTESSVSTSQQRVVNRNFLNQLTAEYSTDISGVCSGTECQEMEAKILEFVLGASRAIDLSFEKTADGGVQLMRDQIAYVTLSPTQYETLLETAPTFESDTETTETAAMGGDEGASGTKTDKEKTKVVDDVSWKLVGSVPTPTNARLFLIDDLDLERSLNLDWSRMIPVERVDVQIDAVYPASGYRRGDVVPQANYQGLQNHILNCRSGALEKPLATSRTVSDWDSSTNCGNGLSAVWNADPGNFFLLGQNDPVTIKKELGLRSRNTSVTEHGENVKQDGFFNRVQAAKSITFKGHTKRGRGSNKSCGADYEVTARQFPESCAPFLVKGYRVR